MQRLVVPVLSLALFLALPAAAQAPPGARPPAAPGQPAPNPALEAAQAAFDALPEATRRQIQDDLIWASNFTATTSGQYGARTHAAIVGFQRQIRATPNGVLDDAQRRALTDAANRARAAARLAMQADPRTGASLPIAQALFTKRETLPSGTRWESADGQVLLETGVGQGGARELPAAFERFVNLPTPGRKVTYKLLRPDFFVVSGEIGPRSFYVRYVVGPNNLRGYALSYPTGRAAELERHVISIANGFQAVPGQPAPGAAATAAQTPAVAPPPNPNLIPPGLFLTGVVLAPGRVATAALAAECAEPRVNGRPARLLPRGQGGPALLEADTAGLKPLAAPTSDGVGEDVVVVAFSPGARPALAAAAGRRFLAGRGTRIAAPMHREGGGALALDRKGGVVGLLEAPRQAPRLVAGLVPAESHALTPLAAGPPAQGGEKSVGAIVAEVAASLAPIACMQPVSLPK